MLTAIIPTKNEQEFLPNCLKSVAFADEIIVLDSGSTDNTVSIAKKASAKVISYNRKNFSHTHNLGAKKASGDWLLFIDADERVSKQLRQQVIQVINNPTADAYQMPRKNFIMGNALKHGGWYPDLVTRLMRKDKLDKWVGKLHEYPIIKGQTNTLKGEIYHLSHRGLDWMLDKTKNYTKLYASILHKEGHPKVTVKNFFGATLREFYLRAIKKSGWRDGFIGWLEVFYQTFNALLIQVYLWELQRGETMKETYRQLDQELAREF